MNDLPGLAKKLRAQSLIMTTRAGSGHPTTCLSMAEIMSVLYFDVMQYNPQNPEEPANDELILSKGHATPILWAAMAEAGMIAPETLLTYRQYGSILEGHPTPHMPWIKAATGSLGQGLAIGIGIALAQRMQALPSRTFVILGDGECAEGSVWEAAALASKQQLTNLTAIVDVNRLGQSGESLHGAHVNAWKTKWLAFGWDAKIVDGHDTKALRKALKKKTNRPLVVLAKTKKGKGVSFLEDKEGWHGKVLDEKQLAQALLELGQITNVKASINIPTPVEPEKKSALNTINGPSYASDALVSTREAFGTMLEKLGVNEKIIVLDGDTKNSTYTALFEKHYPNRFIECYIAEQNMIGVAVGLSAKGYLCVPATFAAFFTRAHDQIRMAALSQANLHIVGSHAGVSIGEDGPSQMGLEDLAMMRSIPGSVVLYPSDAVSAEYLTKLMIEHTGISYLRTSRPKTPLLYTSQEAFVIGGSKLVKRDVGDNIVIITAGITVHEALKAAKKMKGVSVLDAYSIKPLDEKTIKEQAKRKKVVVIEDHYAQGGLGEAISKLGIPITHLCVQDIPRSGSSERLLEEHGLDAENITKVLRRL